MTTYIKKSIVTKNLGLYIEIDVVNETADKIEIQDKGGILLTLTDVKIKDIWDLSEILEVAGRELQACEEIKLKEEEENEKAN